MSRPINESIQTLETSRDNIVEALNAKLGGVDAQLKISDVADKINSIETGGGALPFNYIENVSYRTMSQSETNPCLIEDTHNDEYGTSNGGTFKFKVKKNCKVYHLQHLSSGNRNATMDAQALNDYGTSLSQGDSKEIKIDSSSSQCFDILLFGDVSDYMTTNMPDVIIFASRLFA